VRDSPEISRARSLLQSAQACSSASRLLIANGGESIAVGILSGHAIEAALKSFLAFNGKSERELKTLGHNLIDSWAAALALGMDILPSPPGWLHGLNHNIENMLYRYPNSSSVSWIPDPDRMLDTVEELVEIMEQTLPEPHHEIPF
jgi:hypothetical protein